MRKISGVLFLIVISFGISQAQQLPSQVGFTDNNNNLKTQNTSLRPKPYESKLEESPLLFKTFHQGYVISKSGEKIEMQSTNYNILLKQLVFEDQGEIFSIDDRYFDSLYVYNNNQLEKYCFRNIGINSATKLVKVMDEGQYSLFAYTEASLVQPDYNPVMMTGNKDFTIKTKKLYYFIDNDEIKLLPKRAKKILSSNDFSREFKSLVRKKSPKLKKEKDIVSFFEAINVSLDEQS